MLLAFQAKSKKSPTSGIGADGRVYPDVGNHPQKRRFWHSSPVRVDDQHCRYDSAEHVTHAWNKPQDGIEADSNSADRNRSIHQPRNLLDRFFGSRGVLVADELTIDDLDISPPG